MTSERNMRHYHMTVAIPTFRGWLQEAQERGESASAFAKGGLSWEDFWADLDAREARGERYVTTGCPTPTANGSCPGHGAS